MQFQEPSLNSERQQMAKAYERVSHRLSLAEMVVIGAVLLSLVFSGMSSRLSQFLAFPQPWASALYFLVLMVFLGFLMMPLTYYQGYVMPKRYGLSKQTLKDWLLDGLKASGIGLVLGLAIVIVIYLLIDNFQGTWWLWASVVLFLVTVLLTRLMPTLLLPIFYDLEPLDDADLGQKLTNLAQRARTDICGIFTMDLSSKGTTANAMLAGLGDTRRIILSDTLIEQYTPEEIEVIMAHELGHHLHRDITKMIVLQAGIFLAAFYLGDKVLNFGVAPFDFNGIADVAALPLLALSLATFSLLLTPLVNAFSRKVESLADKAALELTDNPGAFATAMAKLTDQNLSVAFPSRLVELWYYDHPPYVRRIKLARNYSKEVIVGGETSG
jgi:STE24 endopeptidase